MFRFRTFARSLAVVALLAACSQDSEPEAGAQDSEDDSSYVEWVQPQLTPEESAAAVAKIQAHSDSMTRVIRGPDATVSEPYVDTPEKQYAACLANARSIEEPTRSMILQHCERMRTRTPENTP